MSRLALFCLLICCYSVAVLAQTVPYDVTAGRTPDIAMVSMLGDGNEYFIRNNMDTGKVSFSWNKAANIVQMRVFYSGLTNDHLCYFRSPNTAYNQWPDCVHGGRWRFCIVHHTGTLPVKYYYDRNGILLGNEYDYYGNGNLPTMNLTEVMGIGTVMIMTDWAVVRNGVVDQVYTFRYDQFLNFMGTTGVLDGKANVVLNDSTTLINIYSNPNALIKPLPTYSFEDILNDLNAGGLIAVLPTYQPYPEPNDLRGRDNLMRGPVALINAGVSGMFGARLYDTPTCWAAKYGTPEQKANPFEGNVQISNYFAEACVTLGQ